LIFFFFWGIAKATNWMNIPREVQHHIEAAFVVKQSFSPHLHLILFVLGYFGSQLSNSEPCRFQFSLQRELFVSVLLSQEVVLRTHAQSTFESLFQTYHGISCSRLLYSSTLSIC
jgi:hypothetical protein